MITDINSEDRLVQQTFTMDEYVAFIESSRLESDPVLTGRQKTFEKRILTPFCLNGIGKQKTPITRPQSTPGGRSPGTASCRARCGS